MTTLGLTKEVGPHINVLERESRHGGSCAALSSLAGFAYTVLHL
jgi:hypothetical protein